MYNELLKVTDRHYRKIIACIILLFSVVSRMDALSFESRDFQNYLLPWYMQIRELGGFAALSTQVGNYGIAYQTIIAAMTYLPFNPLYLYKGLSILFDYGMALGTGLLASKLAKRDHRFVFWICFFAALLMPTVVMNSSVWGQCDSIYTCFLVFSVLFLLDERYVFSFIFLGLALSFKLQAILIMPLYCFYFYQRRNFRISCFALPFCVLWVSSLPGILHGQSVLCAFNVYKSQTVEQTFQGLGGQFPSFWQLLDSGAVSIDYLLKYSVFVTFSILLAGFLFIRKNKILFKENEEIAAWACWVLWTCLLFLPMMHERYSYPLEMLMLPLALADLPKYGKYLFVCIACATITYGRYLFDLSYSRMGLAFVYITAYMLFSSKLFHQTKML